MNSGADVLSEYQARLAEMQASATHLRLAQIIAFVVFGTAIVAIVLMGFQAITRRNLLMPYSLLTLLVLVYSGRELRRRNAALRQSIRLTRFYERGISRLEGGWAGSGASGEEFSRSDHSYEQDLQLFGKGSLFELLCTCRTEIGRRSLADCLLHAPALEEIKERQAAVEELRGRTDLRERTGILGKFDFEESRWETFMEWLESSQSAAPSAFRAGFLVSSVALGLLVLLGFCRALPWSHLVSLIGLLLAAHTLVGLFYQSRVVDSVKALRSIGLEIGILEEGLKLLQPERFESALLRRIVEPIARDHAPAVIGKLARLIRAVEERDKEWFYAISRALLVGTQLFLAIEKWRASNGVSLSRWLAGWGEFEALLALSGYAYEHPENKYPYLLDSETAFEGQGLGHPLLPVNACVRNDVRLDEATRFYVVSGSNMAGKSTLIRTVGLMPFSRMRALRYAPQVCACRCFPSARPSRSSILFRTENRNFLRRWTDCAWR